MPFRRLAFGIVLAFAAVRSRRSSGEIFEVRMRVGMGMGVGMVVRSDERMLVEYLLPLFAVIVAGAHGQQMERGREGE
jgi:hypothetical protein